MSWLIFLIYLFIFNCDMYLMSQHLFLYRCWWYSVQTHWSQAGPARWNQILHQGVWGKPGFITLHLITFYSDSKWINKTYGCFQITCDILTTKFALNIFVFPQEKRAFRECRLLEKLNKMTSDTNEHDLPQCTESMHEKLCDALTRRKLRYL